MSLLNKKAVKQLALELAQKRHHEFTRVSPEFVNRIEATVRNIIESSIQSLPSLGKTIK